MSPQSSCVHTHEADPSKGGIQGVLVEQEQFGRVCPQHVLISAAQLQEEPRVTLWHLPLYPWGSFLLQLANTKSAWLRMGGRPRACETSQ